jgi:hypothetical protein
MISKHILQKYKKSLSEIPIPGGNGCHGALLGTANLGAMSGLTAEQICSDIRNSIPIGSRDVPDREIFAAVNRAFSDHRQSITLPNGESYCRYTPPKPKPIINNGKITLQNIIKQGTISQEDDLYCLSPISLLDMRKCSLDLFLDTLYDPDDLIWMGERNTPGIMGKSIMRVSDWIRQYELLDSDDPPFFIINPLSGMSMPKKSGDGMTYRGDRCVCIFKYALVEFDTLTREEQIRFWSAVKLPIRCLVDTGGKSIHALLDVQKIADVTTLAQWETVVKKNLYDQYLTPMGVDSNCSNPARLSRVPGHYRAEKQTLQRLLWLTSVGRSISND